MKNKDDDFKRNVLDILYQIAVAIEKMQDELKRQRYNQQAKAKPTLIKDLQENGII